MFRVHEKVPSSVSCKQRHPKCVTYVQSAPQFCFGRHHCRKANFFFFFLNNTVSRDVEWFAPGFQNKTSL